MNPDPRMNACDVAGELVGHTDMGSVYFIVCMHVENPLRLSTSEKLGTVLLMEPHLKSHATVGHIDYT